MQVYINSYNHLFNHRSIGVDFNFDSSNNPELSASWNFEKAAMYASGYRFSWKDRALRKDPHYRRFTGRAKHPNLGFLDVFVFDPQYVKDYAFDRLLAFKEGKIKLSNIFQYEAEVIFHSMIPKQYHARRCIISVPSFDTNYSASCFARYNIKSKATHTRKRNLIRELPARSSEEYRKAINTITENASAAQAKIIEQTAHCRLFKNKPRKAVVYDHGDKLVATLPKP